MIKLSIRAAIMLVVVLTSCTKNNPDSPTQKLDTTVTKVKGNMNQLISIVEIPTTDFERAVMFYKAILNITVEEVDMGEVKMGLFPGNGETVSVALIKGADYKPSKDGTIVYLSAGDDLLVALNKVEKNGGSIVVPKTEISPEMGFFAMFIDTEGNKLGLHSKK
jgi:predicted enzyme related to lactoylglutathione lyase